MILPQPALKHFPFPSYRAPRRLDRERRRLVRPQAVRDPGGAGAGDPPGEAAVDVRLDEEGRAARRRRARARGVDPRPRERGQSGPRPPRMPLPARYQAAGRGEVGEQAARRAVGRVNRADESPRLGPQPPHRGRAQLGKVGAPVHGAKVGEEAGVV